MNCDARVMEFFRSSLSRPESDAIVDGILTHFSKYGFGLWAIESPVSLPLSVSPDWLSHASAPISRPVWKSAASSFRALGTRLCDRGGPVGA